MKIFLIPSEPNAMGGYNPKYLTEIPAPARGLTRWDHPAGVGLYLVGVRDEADTSALEAHADVRRLDTGITREFVESLGVDTSGLGAEPTQAELGTLLLQWLTGDPTADLAQELANGV
jgi:hypothetical protein